MKRFISLMLTLAMVFALCLSASASDVTSTQGTDPLSPWVLEKFDTGDEYLLNCTTGEIIAKAFTYNEMGELAEIDLNEYLILKNSLFHETNMETTAMDSLTPYIETTYFYRYRESSVTTIHGTPVKVTPDIKGSATVSYVNSVTIEDSFGGSVSMTGTIENQIEVGASFDWHTSLSSGTSIGTEYQVPAGYIGYIQFTPYFNKTSGNLYYVVASPFDQNEIYLGEAWGYSPKKIAGGIADGMYELVLRAS